MLSFTCAANSRVGVIIRARIGDFPFVLDVLLRRYNKGRVKPAVFPVPV